MIEYACGRCRKLITDIKAKVSGGKVIVTLRCHGDSAEIILNPDARGVLFTGRPAVTVSNRDPKAWADPSIEARGLIDGDMGDL